MSSIELTGGKPLYGELEIQGSKNAVLPILAATILNKGISVLTGCPKISDVFHMTEVLQALGCNITWNENSLVVDATTLAQEEISEEIAKKTRASILFLGALLGRNNRAVVAYPGGCSIGKRPIDLHLKALKEMGVEEKFSEDEKLICETSELKGNEIYLNFPSVGATENIILAAVLASGTTVIHGAAMEPEIVALCDFLVSAGAKIEGIGTSRIKVIGVKQLNDTSYHVPKDRIVAGTYLTLVASTGGKVLLHGVKENELAAVLFELKKAGLKLRLVEDHCYIERTERLKPLQIETKPFPAFPTDMQSQFMAMLCTADGESTLIENIFEARFLIIDELKKLGAKITVYENRAIITGVEKLTGANITAKELRGGAALVIAGLTAMGSTIVENTDYIYRGYEDICKDLRQLGAQIKTFSKEELIGHGKAHTKD
ncbi:UDP-N-acetylglucosamine 1-carboxyvinyltransferase [Clostridium sp. Marseille-P299]|uniref:UDP-N-acetylglucosamine 1-carboxyvinyltransferase n=1 Tax=Clostridium sp. Marseille-P299 TaxID=1805477 RepID=UPI00082D34BA|nr:UDP-N-acetylglucosamine 1-carboxyvinyltransferase [Clostridium sp. Marseille-P299]